MRQCHQTLSDLRTVNTFINTNYKTNVEDIPESGIVFKEYMIESNIIDTDHKIILIDIQELFNFTGSNRYVLESCLEELSLFRKFKNFDVLLPKLSRDGK